MFKKRTAAPKINSQTFRNQTMEVLDGLNRQINDGIEGLEGMITLAGISEKERNDLTKAQIQLNYLSNKMQHTRSEVDNLTYTTEELQELENRVTGNEVLYTATKKTRENLGNALEESMGEIVTELGEISNELGETYHKSFSKAQKSLTKLGEKVRNTYAPTKTKDQKKWQKEHSLAAYTTAYVAIAGVLGALIMSKANITGAFIGSGAKAGLSVVLILALIFIGYLIFNHDKPKVKKTKKKPVKKKKKTTKKKSTKK